MKTRYFSLFEKIRFFYSIFGMLTGIIGVIGFLAMFFVPIMETKIALYNSNTYADGTEEAIVKINENRYKHTINYVVDGKSYSISFINLTPDTIKDKIKVIYLAENPATATLDEISIWSIIIPILFVSLFTLICFGSFAYGIKKNITKP